MINIINHENRAKYLDLIDQSYLLRHKIFKQKLDWDVNSIEGREYDEFDILAGTVYLLHVDDAGKVNGCVRLLPTNGPNMLKNIFNMLLDGQQAPASPDVWESTRFAVDIDELGAAEAGKVTAKLLDAIAEIGLIYGLDKIISVTDPLMERALKRRGLPTTRIGSVHQVGICKAVAGYFIPTTQTLLELREKSGLTVSQITNVPLIHRAA